MKTGIYQHYKGPKYLVIDTVRHSETEELLVLYKPMQGEDNLWVRPFDMFFEEIEINKQLVPRFKYIGADCE